MLMRSYSRYDLLTEQMNTIGKSRNNVWTSFLGRLLKQEDWIPLTLKLPQYEILRAEMFIEDIAECMDYELTLTVVDLIALLYSDFILQVRKGHKTGLKALALKLMQKYDKLLDPKVLVRQYKKQQVNHWVLDEKLKAPKRRMYYVELEISRRSVLRGEVLLHDMNEACPSFTLTLEQLMATLFMDFIADVKAGKSKERIDVLLAALSDS